MKNEVPTYDGNGRKIIIEFLGYIASFEHIGNMSHWEKEATVAAILKDLVIKNAIGVRPTQLTERYLYE